MNYIDGVAGNNSHLHNAFLKFCNPDCEHKAAMDKSKKLLALYTAASSKNVDLNTWLDWMTRRKGTDFEFINVNIPDNISEEEMYLMIAAATKPNRKIIVGSHQFYNGFCYYPDCSKVKYNDIDITILDKDEAFLELNPKNNQLITNIMHAKNNPWLSGSFYLFAFVAIIGSILVVAQVLPFYTFPIVIIGSILAFSVVVAFQLRNDEKLSDKSFLQLMGMSFNQIPFLKNTDINEK